MNNRTLVRALVTLVVTATVVNVAVAVFDDGTLGIAEFRTSAFGDPYVETEYTVFIQSGVPFPTVRAFTAGGSLIETAPPSFELGLNASGDNLTVTFVESSFNATNTYSLVFLPRFNYITAVQLRYNGTTYPKQTVSVAESGPDGLMRLPVNAGTSFTMLNVSRQDAYDLEWEGPHPSPNHDRQSVVIATFRSVNGTWTAETCPNQEFEC